MGVGPRDIRVIRTDSLEDMGTPDNTDGVLIRDATDGVVKFAQVSNLSTNLEEVQDNLGTSFLIGGDNVSLTYDDVGNTLTIDSPGITDHSLLTGLSGDDHTQYLNSTRHDTEDHSTAMSTVVIDDINNVVITTPTVGDYLYYNGTNWANKEITTADVQSGTFDDARIAESNVTQHQAALSITESQISDLSHLTLEQVQDNLGGGFLIGGTSLTTSYDDVANTFTFNVDETTLTVTESQVSDLAHLTLEQVQDNLGNSVLTAGDNISINYDDGANTITIAVAGSTTSPFLLMGV